MSNNVYNTTDPERLLRLKRLEAEALRDVIRAFKQFHHKPANMFKIVQNTLLAQLGVAKMGFLFRVNDEMQTGITRGFKAFQDPQYKELPTEAGVIRITKEAQPLLHAAGVENVVTFTFHDSPSAWFLLADFAETETERENDLIFIETLGYVITAILENNYLVGEMISQESLKRELEVAEKIQRQLLLTEFGHITGAEVAAFNEPHHRVGGDFYDVISRGDKGFFVCIADVSGKGIGAALLMASLQAQFRALILSENTLKDVIKGLHKSLIQITGGEQYVTLFLAHIQKENRVIDYINAGHNYPLFIHGNEVTELKEGTIPLGMLDLPFVHEGKLNWTPGDRLFLFTDGLPDQLNQKGDMIGDSRTRDFLGSWDTESPAEMIAHVIEKWKDFSGGVEASDDVTLVALRLV